MLIFRFEFTNMERKLKGACTIIEYDYMFCTNFPSSKY